jgi:hypothetical protein
MRSLSRHRRTTRDGWSVLRTVEFGDRVAVVDSFVAENPRLPMDIRRKVLQARDELERTVRIRAAR